MILINKIKLQGITEKPKKMSNRNLNLLKKITNQPVEAWSH